MPNQKIHMERAVVVERSNALVYLITSFELELKVEGSNPGIAVPFLGRQFSSENELIRVFSRDNSRNLDFRNIRTKSIS